MTKFKSNYRKARGARWFWYLLSLVFFVMACRAFPAEPGEAMFAFIFWSGMAGGMFYSARKKVKSDG